MPREANTAVPPVIVPPEIASVPDWEWNTPTPFAGAVIVPPLIETAVSEAWLPLAETPVPASIAPPFIVKAAPAPYMTTPEEVAERLPPFIVAEAPS